MQLQERKSPLFQTVAQRLVHGQVPISTILEINDLMRTKNIEVLASTQIGMKERFLVGRRLEQFEFMSNPVVLDVDTSDYLTITVPRLHTDVDYVQRFPIAADIEYVLYDGTVIRQNMYGIKAALYMCAIGYLDAQPPWRYEPIGDW